jgi:hypothetical protein
MTKTDVIRFYDQPECIGLKVLTVTLYHASEQQDYEKHSRFHKRDGRQMDFVTLTSDFEEHIGFMVDVTYGVIIVLSLRSRKELLTSMTTMRSARKAIKIFMVFIIF